MQPNAGLPELVDGQTHYPLGAAEMASWMERFVAEDGLNLIGGCCGTSTPHIQALDAMLRRRGGVPPGAGGAPPGLGPVGRQPVRPDAAAAGEQLLLHRRALQRQRLEEVARAAGAGDWDGCVSVGREQVAEGSNSLDICTAFVGRDEVCEMNEVIRRFTSR